MEINSLVPKLILSQELIDDGGMLVPQEFVRDIMAIEAFYIEHPDVERYIVSPRPGLGAWWHRLMGQGL